MREFRTVNEIREERALQRNNVIIYNMLAVMIGELDRLPIPRGQEPTSEQIYGVIKRMHESAQMMKDLKSESGVEFEYLKDFIKQQMTEDQLKDVIKESGCKNIGEIMKYLKTNYNGGYDGKMASKVAGEYIRSL